MSSSSPSSASVSVVVVSHNEGTELAATVHGLLATLPRGGELVVVDDASTDGSAERLSEPYPTVRVLRQERRLGLARARNLGARHTSGQILAFADAHIDATLDWLDHFAAVLERPEVGLVAPTVTVRGNDAARGCGLTFKDAALGASWLAPRGRDPYPVPMLGGCFLAMRRDVFEATGGFDEGLVFWGCEDCELSIRLWMMGHECVVVPTARVSHLFRRRFPYSLPADAITHNALRVASIHLAPERFSQAVRLLAQRSEFPTALARFVESDALRRRKEVRERRRYDDDWFCERFGIDVFAANGKGGTP